MICYNPLKKNQKYCKISELYFTVQVKKGIRIYNLKIPIVSLMFDEGTYDF